MKVFEWLSIVIMAFLIEELIRYKVNVFSFFQEKEGGKLSSKRLSMIACTGLFLWMGKKLIIMPEVEIMNVIIFLVTGLFAFFPNSARELIAKFLDKNAGSKKEQ